MSGKNASQIMIAKKASRYMKKKMLNGYSKICLT